MSRNGSDLDTCPPSNISTQNATHYGPGYCEFTLWHVEFTVESNDRVQFLAVVPRLGQARHSEWSAPGQFEEWRIHR